jgi:hypothetical protein
LDTIFEYTELAQSRPSGTSAVSVFNPTALAFIDTLIVANVGSSTAKFSIYLDKDGTTYSEATALYFQNSLHSGTTLEFHFEKGIPITKSGNLAVQTDTANAITFSVYGRNRIA